MTSSIRAVLATAVMAALTTASASASAEDCEGLDGMNVAAGGGLGMGVTVLSSFLFPAFAMAGNDDLSYWKGFAYTASGGGSGVIAAAMVSNEVACEAALWAPALNGMATALAATIIWASTDPGSEPEYDGDGDGWISSWSLDAAIGEDVGSVRLRVSF
jgi:hypothetical protein